MCLRLPCMQLLLLTLAPTPDIGIPWESQQCWTASLVADHLLTLQG